jgi:hypothetical protein
MISVHAKVRFIERCVDQKAVQRERKAGLDDHMIYAKLHGSYVNELDAYGTALERFIEGWTVRQALPNKFKVRAGAAVAVFTDGVCVTTIRRRRHEPVPRRETRRYRNNRLSY